MSKEANEAEIGAYSDNRIKYARKVAIALSLQLQQEDYPDYELKRKVGEKAAGEFDDIVIEYEENGEVKYKLIKIKYNGKGKSLTIDELIEASDFEVVKYYESYKKLSDEYKGVNVELILYTNRPFENSIRQQKNIAIGYFEEGYESLLVKQKDKAQILDGPDDKQERYKFDIKDDKGEIDKEKIKKISKLILEKESNDEDLKEFLEKFTLAVNQPGLDKLYGIIKNKIKEELRFEDESFFYELTDKVSNTKSLSKKWLKGKMGERIPIKEKWWPRQGKLPRSFVEKRDEDQLLVTKLHNILETSAAVPRKASITGLGGIGKTATAKWYADVYKDKYDHIFWINSEKNKANDKFRELAVKLKIKIILDDKTPKDIEIIANEIYTKLKRKNECLFIFDNADRYEDIIDLLPPKEDINFYTLITSRNKNWGTVQKIPQLKLGIFSEQEAIKFIRGENALGSSASEEDAKALAKELGYLPLALQMAVLYINETREIERNYSIKKYLEEYNKEKARFLNYGKLGDYGKTVLTTWQVTLDQIKENEHFGELAIKVLNIMSYLSPDDISKEIFQELLEDKTLFLDYVIGLLNDYSMIKVKNEQIKIHPLVQEVIRINLRENKKEEETLKKAFDLVTNNFPSGDSINNLTKIRKLLTHSEALLKHIDSWISNKPEKRKEIEQGYLEKLLPLMTNAYGSLGNPQKKKELLERALDIQEKHYGPDHYGVARTLGNPRIACTTRFKQNI